MLTVTINGREAVPLRAVPYVTYGFLDIKQVAAALVNPVSYDESWQFATEFPRARRLSTGNQVVDLPAGSHRVWAEACIDSSLNRNSAELIKLAPEGYFVWRDELESCFRAMDEELTERAGEVTGEEPFESRAFSVDPYIAPSDRAVVMAGFEAMSRRTTPAVQQKAPRDLGIDPELQKEAEALARDPRMRDSRGRPPSRKRIARELAEKHRMAAETVERRIRKNWT